MRVEEGHEPVCALFDWQTEQWVGVCECGWRGPIVEYASHYESEEAKP